MEVETGVLERQLARPGWEFRTVDGRNRLPVVQHGLEYRRRRPDALGPGVHDGRAADRGEPDPPVAHLAHGGLGPPIAFRAAQPVGHRVADRPHPPGLAVRPVVEVPLERLEDALVGRHPEVPEFVLLNGERGVVVEPLAHRQRADSVPDDPAEPAAEGPDPEGTGLILVERQHVVVTEAVGDREGPGAVRPDAREPTVSGEPESPGSVEEDALDGWRDGVAGRSHGREAAVLQRRQAARRRANEQRAVPHRQQGPDAALEDVAGVGKRDDPPGPDLRQAPRPADPYLPVVAFRQCHDNVVDESLAHRVLGELAVRQSRHAAAGGAQPDVAVSRLEDGLHIVGREPLAHAESSERCLAQAGEARIEQTDPHVAIAVLEERVDLVAGQALRLAVDLGPTVPDPHETPTLEAEPERALPVEEDEMDRIVHGKRPRRGVVTREACEASRSTNPQAPGLVFADIVDRIVGQSLGGTEPLKSARREAIQAVPRREPEAPVPRLAELCDLGEGGQFRRPLEAEARTPADAVLRAHPEHPVPIDKERADPFARQAIGEPEADERAGSQTQQPGVGGHPHVAPAVLGQGPDDVPLKGRGVAAVEGGEADPVESGQSGLRAQPQIPVAALQQRLNAVLRQTGLDLPRQGVVLRQTNAWIQGEQRTGGGQSQHPDRDAHQPMALAKRRHERQVLLYNYRPFAPGLDDGRRRRAGPGGPSTMRGATASPGSGRPRARSTASSGSTASPRASRPSSCRTRPHRASPWGSPRSAPGRSR